MKDSTKVATKVEGAAVAVEVTELSELERISHGEPVAVEVTIRGKAVRVVGRRLTPGETREVQMVMERALPPTLPTKEGEEPRYDFRDEGYRREAETAWRTARAMAVIYAYRIEPLLDGALGAAFETPTAPDGNLDALADAEGTPRVQPDVEPDGGGVHGAGVGLGLSE